MKWSCCSPRPGPTEPWGSPSWGSPRGCSARGLDCQVSIYRVDGKFSQLKANARLWPAEAPQTSQREEGLGGAAGEVHHQEGGLHFPDRDVGSSKTVQMEQRLLGHPVRVEKWAHLYIRTHTHSYSSSGEVVPGLQFSN